MERADAGIQSLACVDAELTAFASLARQRAVGDKMNWVNSRAPSFSVIAIP